MSSETATAPKPTPGAPKGAPGLNLVYQSECSYVWNSLRRLGIHTRDLEDLTHDVFVVVGRKLVDFDATRAIRPWLYGIALRVASDYRKSARYKRELLSAAPPEPNHQGPRPDEELISEQNRELVVQALDTMQFKNRVIFVMHDLNEHTLAEASRELQVPLPTLYSRLQVGREQFATAVRRIREEARP